MSQRQTFKVPLSKVMNSADIGKLTPEDRSRIYDAAEDEDGDESDDDQEVTISYDPSTGKMRVLNISKVKGKRV